MFNMRIAPKLWFEDYAGRFLRTGCQDRENSITDDFDGQAEMLGA